MNEIQPPSAIEQLRQLAAATPKTILLPESADPRVLEAAAILASEGLATPKLIGDAEGFTHAIRDEVEVIDFADSLRFEQCVQRLVDRRRHKGLSISEAKAQIQGSPVLYAALLTALGHADATVAGCATSTADVVRAVLYGIGMSEGVDCLSSFFLMQLNDGRALTYADCGLIPDPDVEQLASIAISAAASHQRLTGQSPRIAMLSFSTHRSADHPRVEKVIAATERVRELRPDLLIDGELQFDAAFVPEVAARKCPNSPIAGMANVFVFPDLDSGNIAYKITQRLAGAVALGPLIQGAAHPMMDLSRGCSVQDIVDVAVVASILAG